MPHVTGHIIIDFATPINSEKPKGLKVWHCALAIFALGVTLGYFVA